ncbi:MAG: SIR2 family protein, partial [bacterium]
DFIDKRIDMKNINQTIITFNYETLFEHALLHKHIFGIYSYGLDIDKNKIINFPSYEESYKGNFLLLKLHGSLNWACCPSCDKNYLTWHNMYDRIISEKCKDCNNNLEPVLIPPTRNKILPARLKKLWDIAQEKITSADEVTIIGSSFNDYDIDASDLIFNSLKSNKRKPILCIADPCALDRGNLLNFRASATRDHFKNIMLFKGFREYLDNKTF